MFTQSDTYTYCRLTNIDWLFTYLWLYIFILSLCSSWTFSQKWEFARWFLWKTESCKRFFPRFIGKSHMYHSWQQTSESCLHRNNIYYNSNAWSIFICLHNVYSNSKSLLFWCWSVFIFQVWLGQVLRTRKQSG